MKTSALFERIDEILWNDWDPIGVNDSDEATDEYRSYVRHLVKLKWGGADQTKIANHLHHIETVNIGLSGNKTRCEEITRKAWKWFNLLRTKTGDLVNKIGHLCSK